MHLKASLFHEKTFRKTQLRSMESPTTAQSRRSSTIAVPGRVAPGPSTFSIAAVRDNNSGILASRRSTGGGGGGGASASAGDPSGSSQPPFKLEPWQSLLALMTVSVAICYADRSNISTAILPMAQQFNWDKTFEGIVLSSFFLGYATTQMAGGALADKYGGKQVLAFGVTAWSLFTFITPQAAAAGAFPLLLCRVFMGIGEGVAFPSIHSLIARHVPVANQTTAVGIATAASYAGTAVAFGLAPLIIDSLGWPWVFYLFGISAAAWLPFWLTTDPPTVIRLPSGASVAPTTSDVGVARRRDSESIGLLSDRTSQRPSEGLQASPATSVRGGLLGALDGFLASDSVRALKALLQRKEVLAICITQYCQSWGMYGLLNWLPSFFQDSYGVEVKDLGGYTLLPYIVQGVLGCVAGAAADRLIAQGAPRRMVRVGLQVIGMIGPALCLLLAVAPGVTGGNPQAASFLITIGLALSSLTLGGVSASQLDIAPKNAGAVFGAGNTAATLAGFLAVPLTGVILDQTDSWTLVFTIIAGHYFVGAGLWAMFAGDKALPEDDIGHTA